MKRRDNLKLILAGGLATGLIVSESCKDKEAPNSQISNKTGGYGRTEEEKKHDEKVMAEKFFTAEEMKTVTILSDIIIPKDEVSGSATDAGVPAFIEFMMNDMPNNQLPMRGGINWLNNKCRNLHNKPFYELTSTQQIEIVDLIAYPDKATPENKPGVKFFNLMRNLVATGFYTTQMGVKDIGYIGNAPNEWDGVPADVLKKYGFENDAKYADVYVKPSERNTIMTWEN